MTEVCLPCLSLVLPRLGPLERGHVARAARLLLRGGGHPLLVRVEAEAELSKGVEGPCNRRVARADSLGERREEVTAT